MTKQEIETKIAELETEKYDLEFKLKELDKKYSPQERLLNILSGCKIKIDKYRHPNSVFFFKDDKCFFEIKNKFLRCSYTDVWIIFEKEFGMKYDDIESLIKYEMEKQFKMIGLIPVLFIRDIDKWIEVHFKNFGLTPDCKIKKK